MTIQEAIHDIHRKATDAYDCYTLLTNDEQCGFLYSLRWSRLSEIPGGWTDEELLAQFRNYFRARKEMLDTEAQK